jgi:hypothetical protein
MISILELCLFDYIVNYNLKVHNAVNILKLVEGDIERNGTI